MNTKNRILASLKGFPASAQGVSYRLDHPKCFVEQALSELKEEGLVTSKRNKLSVTVWSLV